MPKKSNFWIELGDRQLEYYDRQQARSDWGIPTLMVAFLLVGAYLWTRPPGTEFWAKPKVPEFCFEVNSAEQIAAKPCAPGSTGLTDPQFWQCLGGKMYQWRSIDDHVACMNR
jgi:hypothetical protein